MARPTLDRNVKYKRLIVRLGIPRPYVRGLLETLWDVAHECGNPIIGTADDVEAAAEWPGDPGTFLEALRDGGWLDELPEGTWQIHDYFDHAPHYVNGRAQKETERQKDKTCAHCGGPFRSTEVHAKYCTDSCRTLAYRQRKFTEVDEGLREIHGVFTEVHGPPAPAPAPAPFLGEDSPKNPSCSEPQAASERKAAKGKPKRTLPVGFDRFWAAYPRKASKAAAEKAWAKIVPDEALLGAMLKAIDAQKASETWRRDGGQYIPHPATWLNNRRWEDELHVVAPGGPPTGPQSEVVSDAQLLKERAERRAKYGLEGGHES